MKKNVMIFGLIGIVLFFIEGCDSSTEPINVNSISLITQNNSYSKTGTETVIINLKNNSSNEVYLPTDSTFVVEKKEGENWVTGIWWIHRIGIYNYYTLYPNISHSEEIVLGFFPSIGIYRIKFFIYKDSSLSELLPESLLYSNTFEITE